MADLTFRIHFTLPDGSECSTEISGKTVEELRALADAVLKDKNAKTDPEPWSEEIDG